MALQGAQKIIDLALEAAAEVRIINVRHAFIQASDNLAKITNALGLQQFDNVDNTHRNFDVLRRAKSDLENMIIEAALSAAGEPGDSLLQMKQSLAIIEKGISLNCPFDEEGDERNEMLMAAEAGLRAGIKIQEDKELEQAWEKAKFHYR